MWLPRAPCPVICPYTTLFRSMVMSRAAVARSTRHRRRKHSLRQKSGPAVFGPNTNTQVPPMQGYFPDSARTEARSEEHTSELQSLRHLVCRLLLEKKTPSHIK